MSLLNNDVHAQTVNFRAWLQTFPATLLTKLQRPFIGHATFFDHVLSLPSFSGGTETEAIARAAVEKMRARTDADGMYRDPDLFDINIVQLLLLAVELAIEVDCASELMETLHECAQHCPQGDSHRLLYFIWAVHNSKV